MHQEQETRENDGSYGVVCSLLLRAAAKSISDRIITVFSRQSQGLSQSPNPHEHFETIPLLAASWWPFWRETGLAYTVDYRRRVDSSRTDSGHRAREGRPAQKGQMGAAMPRGAAAGLLPLTIGTGFSFASLWIALDWDGANSPPPPLASQRVLDPALVLKYGWGGGA